MSTFNNIKQYIYTSALCFSLTSLPASAATLVQNYSWLTNDTGSYSAPSSANSGPRTFQSNLTDTTYKNYSLFNPALGTLNTVTIELLNISALTNANATFIDTDNFSNTSGMVNLTSMQMNAVVNGVNVNRSIFNRTANCSDNSTFGDASCNAVIPLANSGLASATLLFSGSQLAPFMGPGSASASFTQVGTLTATETNGDDGFVNSAYGLLQINGDLRVTYNYSPAVTTVPVPAAAWLMGSGLLMLTGLARRRA